MFFLGFLLHKFHCLTHSNIFCLDLKKMTIKGLDQMPNISDTLFKDVIKHLQLTHLTLTSRYPVRLVRGVM